MTSIWAGSQIVQSTANADNSMLAERFIATAGQTVFTISSFVYQTGTGSLSVFLNGVDQFITTDYTETSNTSITFTSALKAGDQVVIRGFVGGENTASSAASASIATTKAAEALASANTANTAASTATTQAGIATTKATEAAASAANAAATLKDTSTTNTNVASGTKVFTVSAGKGFQAGQFVTITSASVITDYMYGIITDYTGTSLTVSVTNLNGTATYNSWNVSVSGLVGPAGLSGINNVVRVSTNYQLTNAATVLEVTPTGYGVTVTLPNASGMTPIDPIYTIINAGSYPIVIKDSQGGLKGFLVGGKKSAVALVAASAAGTWSLSNISSAGVSLSKSIGTVSTLTKVIAIDATRDFLLFGTYGAVYDYSTNTFGTPVLLRAGATFLDCVLSAANQVLVVSCDSSTAFQAVALTISGTTITVNTAASATLSGSFQSFSDCGVLPCNGSFIVGYRVTTPNNEIRAISISGTTVTIGAAAVQTGTKANGYLNNVACLMAVSGSVVIVFSAANTNLYSTPYSVSGTTLTVGTQGTLAGLTSYNLQSLVTLPSGRWLILGLDANTVASLVSLSGTTTSHSNVLSVFASGNYQGFAVVGNNKVVITGSSSATCYILTDTAGTLSLGSPTSTGGTACRIMYVSGNNVVMYNAGGGTNGVEVHDASGSATTILARYGISGTNIVAPASGNPDNLGRKLTGELLSTASAKYLCFDTSGANTAVNSLLASGPLGIVSMFEDRTIDYAVPSNTIRGVTDSSRWKFANYTSTPTVYKMEIA